MVDKTKVHTHDWDHNGHLVCITNFNFGCPREEAKSDES